jgi:ribosomal protein L29
MKKHMKTIRDKNDGELKKLLQEKREELRTLRFTSAGARPKDSNAPANVKKEIARILTERTARKKVGK